ncbi:glycerophosphodiester phosphodiesterase family protein, partial [Aeromonas veronii]
VLVYTVDYPEDYETLSSMGVDGIFTNRPDRFL